MTPTVGRVVHYTNLGDADGRYPPEQIAAIITKVKDDDTVSLAIIYPTGMFWMTDVHRSDDYERGFWSWPPRV